MLENSVDILSDYERSGSQCNLGGVWMVLLRLIF